MREKCTICKGKWGKRSRGDKLLGQIGRRKDKKVVDTKGKAPGE